MSSAHVAHATSLARFIDRSPSPFHVVASGVAMLSEAGFVAVASADAHPAGAGRFFTATDGSLMAWVVPEAAAADTPFRIVGAHTDSPNLRLKPRPDSDIGGYRRLGVEVYGGVLLNSWLDRDLGISGRVSVRGDAAIPSTRLVLIDEAIARIPQLAIHLDRDVNDKGLVLDRQKHLGAITGIESASVLEVVSKRVDVAMTDIVGFDLMLHDVAPATLLGGNNEFISAARLDNQLSCHAALTALIGSSSPDVVSVITLFDHEEVGSVSGTGAATSRLPRLLRRVTAQLGGDDAGHDRALADSLFVSADNAHATHPNFQERHDPEHVVMMNGGPVLKFNASQRYTTDAVSAGLFRLASERAGVATQEFVSRSNMPCGSTIGPTVAASLGVRALDVGCAQLAMHSARELAGADDPWDLTLLLAELLA